MTTNVNLIIYITLSLDVICPQPAHSFLPSLLHSFFVFFSSCHAECQVMDCAFCPTQGNKCFKCKPGLYKLPAGRSSDFCFSHCPSGYVPKTVNGVNVCKRCKNTVIPKHLKLNLKQGRRRRPQDHMPLVISRAQLFKSRLTLISD